MSGGVQQFVNYPVFDSRLLFKKSRLLQLAYIACSCAFQNNLIAWIHLVNKPDSVICPFFVLCAMLDDYSCGHSLFNDPPVKYALTILKSLFEDGNVVTVAFDHRLRVGENGSSFIHQHLLFFIARGEVSDQQLAGLSLTRCLGSL